MLGKNTLRAVAIFFGGVVLVFAADHRFAAKKNPIKPRKTHDEISRQQSPKSAAADAKPVRREDVLKTTHRKERAAKKGLMSRSSIISSSSNWTLVPKGAVLHVPALYRKRVDAGRTGTLTTWKEFYGKNRSWIRPVPVTIEQASGAIPIPQDQFESLKSTGQILVAVCRGGPISVKSAPEQAETEPVDEAAAAAAAAAEQKEAEEKAAKEAEALKDLKRRLQKRPR